MSVVDVSTVLSLPCSCELTVDVRIAEDEDETNLRLRVCPCRNHYAHGQDGYGEDLRGCVLLPAEPSGTHGADAAEAAENDVYRDRDVECERPVIQHVDREEQRRADAPFPERHWGRFDEEPSIGVELVV